MIPLPEKLRLDGFTYTRELREGRLCLYEQTVGGICKYYEVFIPRIRKETIFHGTVVPEKEVFPGDEDFGVTAWSCRTLNDVMIRFNKLKLKNPVP
jgi:hypothetical protein